MLIYLRRCSNTNSNDRAIEKPYEKNANHILSAINRPSLHLAHDYNVSISIPKFLYYLILESANSPTKLEPKVLFPVSEYRFQWNLPQVNNNQSLFRKNESKRTKQSVFGVELKKVAKIINFSLLLLSHILYVHIIDCF